MTQTVVSRSVMPAQGEAAKLFPLKVASTAPTAAGFAATRS